MGDYQAKKNNKYILPDYLYKEILCIIRGHEERLEDYLNKIEESPAPADGQPRGTRISDPTAEKAANLEALHRDIRAYEKALEAIPEEYHKGILDNLIKRKRYPDYANRKTWQKWKRRLVWQVARNLNKI